MEKNIYVLEYPWRMAADQRDNKKKITFNKSMDSGDLRVICLVDAPAGCISCDFLLLSLRTIIYCWPFKVCFILDVIIKASNCNSTRRIYISWRINFRIFRLIFRLATGTNVMSLPSLLVQILIRLACLLYITARCTAATYEDESILNVSNV